MIDASPLPLAADLSADLAARAARLPAVLPGDHGVRWSARPSGLLVPHVAYDQPVAVDLFAGAGGFSLGLHQAGFHVAAAVELDFAAALTYLTNLARYGQVQIHFDTAEREDKFSRWLERYLKQEARRDGAAHRPHLAGSGWIAGQPASLRGCEHFWIADVRNVTGQQILDALGLEAGEVYVVCGGPPCQGFSAAGKRDVMDPRNSLVFDFMRLVCEIQPKSFVMENVPALASMVTPEGVPVLDAICRVAEDGGLGPYRALRDSLRTTAGLGAALRRDRRANADQHDHDQEDEGDEQQTLF
jgi:DNA (cytosine-5)-methyltransferase 1